MNKYRVRRIERVLELGRPCWPLTAVARRHPGWYVISRWEYGAWKHRLAVATFDEAMRIACEVARRETTYYEARELAGDNARLII